MSNPLPITLSQYQLQRCARLREKYFNGFFGSDAKALERALRQAMAEGVYLERNGKAKIVHELELQATTKGPFDFDTPKMQATNLADLELRVAALERKQR